MIYIILIILAIVLGIYAINALFTTVAWVSSNVLLFVEKCFYINDVLPPWVSWGLFGLFIGLIVAAYKEAPRYGKSHLRPLLFVLPIGIIFGLSMYNTYHNSSNKDKRNTKIAKEYTIGKSSSDLREVLSTWYGNVNNKPATFIYYREGNQLAGKMIYDGVEEFLDVTSYKKKKSPMAILKGTFYKRLDGTNKSFSLHTFYVTSINKNNSYMEGHFEDSRGNKGKWSVHKKMDSFAKTAISTPETYVSKGVSDISKTVSSIGTWQTETIETNKSLYKYASLAMDTNNKAHLSYYDETNKVLKYATDVSGSWVTSIVDTGKNIGKFSNIIVGALDKVYISYYDAEDTSVKYITNALGNYWKTINVGNINIAGVFVSMVYDTAGKVHMSFYDDANKTLKYAANASGKWRITDIESNKNIGEFTLISIDGPGKVYITYYDRADKAIKYTTNNSGLWKTEKVADVEAMGTLASMIYDKSGGIHLCFYDDTTNVLSYAYTPFKQWKLYTIEGSKDCGEFTNIALDASNKVHIVYYDTAEKVLRCTTFTKGWLGITAKNVSPALAKSLNTNITEGVIVEDIQNGSFAQDAGFECNDILITFDKKPLSNVEQLKELVDQTELGKQVKVVVLRNGSEKTLAFTMGEQTVNTNETVQEISSDTLVTEANLQEAFSNQNISEQPSYNRIIEEKPVKISKSRETIHYSKSYSFGRKDKDDEKREEKNTKVESKKSKYTKKGNKSDKKKKTKKKKTKTKKKK